MIDCNRMKLWYCWALCISAFNSAQMVYFQKIVFLRPQRGCMWSLEASEGVCRPLKSHNRSTKSFRGFWNQWLELYMFDTAPGTLTRKRRSLLAILSEPISFLVIYNEFIFKILSMEIEGIFARLLWRRIMFSKEDQNSTGESKGGFYDRATVLYNPHCLPLMILFWENNPLMTC